MKSRLERDFLLTCVPTAVNRVPDLSVFAASAGIKYREKTELPDFENLTNKALDLVFIPTKIPLET